MSFDSIRELFEGFDLHHMGRFSESFSSAADVRAKLDAGGSLAGIRLVGLDLSSADLSGANLTGATLLQCTLTHQCGNAEGAMLLG